MISGKKKFIIYTTVTVSLLAGSGLALSSYITKWENKQANQASEARLNEAAQSASVPGGSEPLDDYEVEILLHEMTHQKVEADQKWGFVEMTPSNIKSAIQLVEQNKNNLVHYAFYMEALKKWEKGDFSNCVEVHNQIWNWQGGSVGEATDLSSPREEARFLKQYQ